MMVDKEWWLRSQYYYFYYYFYHQYFFYLLQNIQLLPAVHKILSTIVESDCFPILLVDYTTCGKKDDCCAKKWFLEDFLHVENVKYNEGNMSLSFDEFIFPQF